MSTYDTEPAVQLIPAPVLTEPDALVEYIYALPGTDHIPDLESQDVMAQYLIDRFTPDEGPKTRVVLTESGRTLPGITREPAGIKEVTRWRKLNPKEWLLSPRAAGAIMLGSLALFNTVGNYNTVTGAAAHTRHAIYRVFSPVKDHVVTETHTVTTPGEVRHINLEADVTNTVGVVQVDPEVVRQFIDQIRQAEQNGGIAAEVDVTGNTSDEWSDDSSIAVDDQDNATLSLQRAQAGDRELIEEGLTTNESLIKVNAEEHTITFTEKEDVLSAANDEGYNTITAAIQAVDQGREVSPGLAQKIKQLFTAPGKRGVTFSATIQYPGEQHTTTETTRTVIPGKDTKPKVPKPGFYGFIPLLPIRRRERYGKVKQLHHWQLTPSMPVLKPEIIKEEVDQAWVRVRPEAINDDGSFVENAWSFTRKFEHLLRDRRIKDVIRADYQNAKGEDKSLRIMFVDTEPSVETVEMFTGLLQKFAAMEGGKLGDRISGIFIYLSENAGTGHGDPKRIAMGIDKQSSENVLGTRTYALKFVELHMPSTLEPDELEALFKSFNGTAWVASHEVGGHGTDESDAPLRARRVMARTIPNAYVIDGDPRARKMSRLDKALRKLPRRPSQKNSPIEFDISYPVVDNDGQVVTMNARVNEHDPRLTHATDATIVGYQPTRYSGESVSEHYAETAASVITSIRVPFEEAHVSVGQLQADNGQSAHFANGYRPAKQGQALYTHAVGAKSGSFPITFSNPPEVTISHIQPEDDPLIRQEMIRTARVRTLQPNQMKAILARVARTVQNR